MKSEIPLPSKDSESILTYIPKASEYPEDVGLFYDLQKLCQLKSNDKMFQELNIVLKKYE